MLDRCLYPPSFHHITSIRYEQGRSKAWEKPVCTAAVSSTSISVFGATADIPATPVLVGPVVLPHTQIPVLSSHCPGWVCYVEKSQPQAIPFLSTVKSAQQIMGTVIKHCLGGVREVYFVSVQPCFDKKLEASRLVRQQHC
jgi:iron only hydrogenase large subunit-like protein